MPAESKDTTSDAQGRFVVSLPKAMGEQIDAIGSRITKELENTAGVAFELSRAQVVQALIKQAITAGEKQVAEEAKAAA